jgi:uncharacterized protein YjbI with pentapeptide repeats
VHDQAVVVRRLGVLLAVVWFVLVGSLATLMVGVFLVLRRLARPQLRVPWLIVAGLLFVSAVLWAAVVEPSWLLPDTRGLAPADRVRAQTDLRTTLVTMLGGLAVLAGAAVGAANLAATQRMQWRAQVTERFSKAIEHLGNEKLDVRLGAVYALEQIARDSPELYGPIMEVLTAYLREHAPAASGDTSRDDPVPADHQAIAAVIARRRWEQDPGDLRLDLHGADLPRVRWESVRLHGADLRGARLEGAALREAHLGRADLRGAHLERADLIQAHLEWADLRGAHLEGAMLEGAYLAAPAQLQEATLSDAGLAQLNLERADLRGAHLERADLRSAQLERADLREAHLAGADLRGAHLEEAHLQDAHLEAADLEGAHLAGAYGLNAEQLSLEQLKEAADLPWELARLVAEASGAFPADPSQTAEAAGGQPAD